MSGTNGSIVPVPGRDIIVRARYPGGISLIDFTDSAKPVEIGCFDHRPIEPEVLVTGGFWSVYRYDGFIHGTEIIRGLDVLKPVPSEYLSENEIAAAVLADQGGTFNPQQQFPVTWPAEPVVAQAYLDQLNRDGALEEELANRLGMALTNAASGQGNAWALKQLAKVVRAVDAEGVTAQRIAGLADTLE